MIIAKALYAAMCSRFLWCAILAALLVGGIMVCSCGRGDEPTYYCDTGRIEYFAGVQAGYARWWCCDDDMESGGFCTEAEVHDGD